MGQLRPEDEESRLRHFFKPKNQYRTLKEVHFTQDQLIGGSVFPVHFRIQLVIKHVGAAHELHLVAAAEALKKTEGVPSLSGELTAVQFQLVSQARKRIFSMNEKEQKIFKNSGGYVKFGTHIPENLLI